jgi:16S rRNA (guanine527-N7)-methyltransferase
MTTPSSRAAVMAALDDAQRFGFLGPGPVSDQVDHATALAALLEATGAGPAPFLDLGSGGGLPGLVLAARWPDHPATLLDGSSRRSAFLRRAIGSLGWESRVTVVEGQAEALARLPDLRAAFALVVARSFAAPAVTAEVGGAFLRVGGVLAVSEPSDGTDTGRWRTEPLTDLGLSPAELHRGTGAGIALISRLRPLDDRWPRGPGAPAKRPLW